MFWLLQYWLMLAGCKQLPHSLHINVTILSIGVSKGFVFYFQWCVGFTVGPALR